MYAPVYTGHIQSQSQSRQRRLERGVEISQAGRRDDTAQNPLGCGGICGSRFYEIYTSM